MDIGVNNAIQLTRKNRLASPSTVVVHLLDDKMQVHGSVICYNLHRQGFVSVWCATSVNLRDIQLIKFLPNDTHNNGKADATMRAPVKNIAVPGLENGMDYVNLGDSDLVVRKCAWGP